MRRRHLSIFAATAVTTDERADAEAVDRAIFDLTPSGVALLALGVRTTALANALLGVGLALLWLPMFALCAYTSPALDDFAESSWGTDFWSLQASRYRTYTGRFVGSIVQGLNPWHWHSLAGYRASAALRIALFVGSGAAFAVAVNRAWLRASTTELAYLGLLLSFAFLANHPSPAQFFYWYSASVVYCVPLSIFLLSAALLLSADRERPRARRFRRAIAGVGFFCAAGNVEMLPLSIVAFGFPLSIYAWARRRSWTVDVALATATSAAAFSVNLASPGNWHRGEEMHLASRSGDALGFLHQVIGQSLDSFSRWLGEPSAELAALLAMPVFWRRARRGLRAPHPVLVAPAWLAAIVVLYTAPLLGLGFTVERVDALCFFFFVLGMFAGACALTVEVERATRRARCHARIVVALAWLAAVALAWTQPPGRNVVRLAYEELTSGRAAAFAAAEQRRAEWTERYPCADVIAPPLGVVSRMLAPIVLPTAFGDDVVAATPEEWWGNDLFAVTHGKRTLHLGVATDLPIACEGERASGHDAGFERLP